MSTELNNPKKIEDVLNSLDGIRRAKAPDFFFTRLKARLDSEFDFGGGPLGRLLTKPALALSLAAVVVALNLAVIMQFRHQEPSLMGDYQAVAAVDYTIGTYPVYEENPIEP